MLNHWPQFRHNSTGERLPKLKDVVMKDARANLDLVSSRYTIRQLDRRLKRVEVKSTDLATLETTYRTEIATIEPTTMFNDFKAELENSIKAADLAAELKVCDNKGLLARAANVLGLKDKKQLMEKVGRLVAGNSGKKVRDELTKVLPVIQVIP